MSDMPLFSGFLPLLIGSVVVFYSAWKLNFDTVWKGYLYFPLVGGLCLFVYGVNVILVWSGSF